MSDLVKQGLEFTAAGLTIVFGVLFMIASFVAIIRKVDRVLMDREENAVAPAAEPQPSMDTLTLVLITATVATMLNGRARVRSIHRVHNDGMARSPWSLQGRASLHGMHVMAKKENNR